MMDTQNLESKFRRIGARFKTRELSRSPWQDSTALRIDIRTDRHGEYFEIAFRGEGTQELEVLDVQPEDRHLLLLIRDGQDKDKYLCGHDERHWFVAGIPERAPVGTVRQAKQALKPKEVAQAESREGLRGKARHSRKNAAFVR